MEYSIEIKGLEALIKKLESSVAEKVIKNSLSEGTQYLAKWSRENRFLPLNPNRKQVNRTTLTSRRASFGYRDRIFGQPPSKIEHDNGVYIGRFGTNANNKGFSYPRLHEYGGIFTHARPVLTPAVKNRENISYIVNKVLKQNIQEELNK